MCPGGSFVKVPEFDKQLKKARGHIGRNIVDITIKMKTIVQKHLMIKIIKLRLRNLDNKYILVFIYIFNSMVDYLRLLVSCRLYSTIIWQKKKKRYSHFTYYSYVLYPASIFVNYTYMSNQKIRFLHHAMMMIHLLLR